MTSQNSNPEFPQPWTNPATVGLWGPALPATPAPSPVPPPPRPRKPWGLGDVAVAFGVLVATQLLLAVVYVVWAALTVDPTGLQAPEMVQAVFDRMPKVMMSGPGMLLGLLTQWAAFLGVPYWAAKRKGLGSLARDFGLRFRWHDPAVGLGLAVSMQASLYGVQKALPLLGVNIDGADNTGMVTDHAGVWLAVMALCAAVGAPVTEEVFFRGLVLRALLRRLAKTDHADSGQTVPALVSSRRRRFGTATSILISALAFGILHTPVSSDPAQSVPVSAMVALAASTGLLGAVLAGAVVRTRRLGPAICAHVIFNSTSVALALLAH